MSRSASRLTCTRGQCSRTTVMVCSEDGSAGRRACSAAIAAVAAQAEEAVRSQLQEHVMSQRGIRSAAIPPSPRRRDDNCMRATERAMLVVRRGDPGVSERRQPHRPPAVTREPPTGGWLGPIPCWFREAEPACEIPASRASRRWIRVLLPLAPSGLHFLAIGAVVGAPGWRHGRIPRRRDDTRRRVMVPEGAPHVRFITR